LVMPRRANRGCCHGSRMFECSRLHTRSSVNELLINDVLKGAWDTAVGQSSRGATPAGSARRTVRARNAAPRSTPCSGNPKRSPDLCDRPTPTAGSAKTAYPTWFGGSCSRCSRSASTGMRPPPNRIWSHTKTLHCRSRGGDGAAASARFPHRGHRRLPARGPDRRPGLTGGTRNLYLIPSSPVDELRKQFPHVHIDLSPASARRRRCWPLGEPTSRSCRHGIRGRSAVALRLTAQVELTGRAFGR
jgi:hypothetical protein